MEVNKSRTPPSSNNGNQGKGNHTATWKLLVLNNADMLRRQIIKKKRQIETGMELKGANFVIRSWWWRLAMMVFSAKFLQQVDIVSME
jgi:hypothetical protein